MKNTARPSLHSHIKRLDQRCSPSTPIFLFRLKSADANSRAESSARTKLNCKDSSELRSLIDPGRPLADYSSIEKLGRFVGDDPYRFFLCGLRVLSQTKVPNPSILKLISIPQKSLRRLVPLLQPNSRGFNSSLPQKRNGEHVSSGYSFALAYDLTSLNPARSPPSPSPLAASRTPPPHRCRGADGRCRGSRRSVESAETAAPSRHRFPLRNTRRWD